jgi:hypothetical protein
MDSHVNFHHHGSHDWVRWCGSLRRPPTLRPVSRGFPHTVAEFDSVDFASARAFQLGFFQTLQSTASCSTDAAPPGILYPALLELSRVSCNNAYGMVVGNCLVTEYACFVDKNCNQCLAALLNATATAPHGNSTSTKADVLRSPACTRATTLLSDFVNNCGGIGFPECTSFKQQCLSLPECASCLTTLDSGDGAETARQCQT